jgi:hypothetical protein
MAENLEVFREVWSMHLSATRNRIIRINLVVTVASFALSICIVPASFFGMNLPHGLEVCACTNLFVHSQHRYLMPELRAVLLDHGQENSLSWGGGC